MKRKFSMFLILVMAGMSLLAACTASSPTDTDVPADAEAETEVQTADQPEAQPETTEPMATGEVKTMYVGSTLVECTGVAPQMCMQVKFSPDEEYTWFYDQIEGFTFEEGYEYELQVRVEQVENPPADGSSLKYTLVEEVSKTAVAAAPETRPADVSTEAASLTGAFWTLVSYAAADGSMSNALAETEVTAVFGEDGSLSGSSGCNSYSTTFTVDGSAITVSDAIAATMMLCEDPVMQQETAYLAGLTAAASFEIAGSTLTLKDAAGSPVLVFNAQQPTPLSGVTWEATMINTGTQAVTSLIAGTTITAVFAEDGTLSGNAGCNNYSAVYQVDGSSITIGMSMSTMMACMEPAGVMEQETAYLAALATAATFTIQGGVLELRTADGALAVSYVAQEPAALGANEWLITSYNNGRGAAVSPLLDTEITLLFQEDGNVTGSAGCNRYFGAFVADGDALQIGPLATTRAYCPEPEGAMTQEQEFLAALQAAATFTIQGDMLDIRMVDGAIAVMAVPNTPLPAEIQALVENAAFQVTAVESGPVTLSGGVYTQAIADSASSVQVTLLEPAAFGQVNGQPAAAVVLATNTGGTGTFIDLALVTFENGQPVNVATTSLGDRVQVNSVDITADGVIVVDMVTHSESDPLCCPTQQVINTYSLQDGALVLTS